MKNGVKSVLLGSSLLAVLALSACGNSSDASTNSAKKDSVSKVSRKSASKKASEKSSSKKAKATEESATKKESEKKAEEQKNQEAAQKASAEAAQSVSVAETQAQPVQQASQAAGAVAPAAQTNNAGGQNTANNAQPAASSETLLNVPFISQGDTMLCEGTSLLMALHYKGVTGQGIYQFVNSMPRSSDNNPYNGYAGEWSHNVDGTYQGMMAAPVVQWANSVGGHATGISGLEAVKNSVRNGNPAVTWITYQYAAPEFKQMPWGRAVWNGHVVLVDGVKPGYIHVVDPVFGASWIGEGTFANSFNTTGMAVSVG